MANARGRRDEGTIRIRRKERAASRGKKAIQCRIRKERQAGSRSVALGTNPIDLVDSEVGKAPVSQS